MPKIAANSIKDLQVLVEVKRHLWRANTNPITISDSDLLLQKLVTEYESGLDPKLRAQIEAVL